MTKKSDPKDLMAISALITNEDESCRPLFRIPVTEPVVETVIAKKQDGFRKQPPVLPAPQECDMGGGSRAMFDFLAAGPPSTIPQTAPTTPTPTAGPSLAQFQSLPPGRQQNLGGGHMPIRQDTVSSLLLAAQMVPRFDPPQQAAPSSTPSDDRPRKRLRTFHIPDNHVNSIQCVAWNRKTHTRCGNPALMNYVGPQPQHCSEHIHLDPDSLYQKCSVVTVDHDTKRHKYCKEVVLKEVQACYKHMPQHLQTAAGLQPEDGEAAVHSTRALVSRLKGLLDDLQKEVNAVKQMDPGEYQRKIKLVPKYQSSITTLTKHEARLTSLLAQSGTRLIAPSSTLAATSASASTSTVKSATMTHAMNSASTPAASTTTLSHLK